MINKLEVYDAPKIKPSKFAVSFEEFSQNKDI